VPASRRELRLVAGTEASAAIIAAVNPLIVVAAGIVALAAGIGVLRTFGPRYRVGRLLAVTPRVAVGEATAIATEARPRYVRVEGRIDAENEFEDAQHRPLVFRRTRLEARRNGGWSAFEDSREAVPFVIREGLDEIAVDTDALDAGLVVVPRESVGIAGDLADRAPAEMHAQTPVRAVVEQVSSIEHAIVLGVPGPGPDEGVRMSAGLGRPLILTTLEPDQAMRVLAGGSGRPRTAAILLAVGLALVTGGLLWAGLGVLLPAIVPAVAAASPTPGTAGDPRSSGEGPGLVGEPGLAILAVIGIALAAAAITTVYVRITSDSSRGGRRGR
jgi:hypothetical protein